MSFYNEHNPWPFGNGALTDVPGPRVKPVPAKKAVKTIQKPNRTRAKKVRPSKVAAKKQARATRKNEKRLSVKKQVLRKAAKRNFTRKRKSTRASKKKRG